MCGTVQRGTAQRGTQYNVAQFCVAQFSVAQYSVSQYSVAQYSVAQYTIGCPVHIRRHTYQDVGLHPLDDLLSKDFLDEFLDDLLSKDLQTHLPRCRAPPS